MIFIVHGVQIPEDEIQFTASRSSGPGGQNVNKVSTRVTLLFDVDRSLSLDGEQRQRIQTKLASRINKEGILRISSQSTRSQEANRADALERFVELLRIALRKERPRIRTRASAAAQEKRVEEKKKRTRLKQLRAKKGWDE